MSAGEGDLRGEVTGDTAFWRDSAYTMEQARDHFRAERDAAVEQRTLAEQRADYFYTLGQEVTDNLRAEIDLLVEQRTLAEQKVARVEELAESLAYLDPRASQLIRAALTDPEADRLSAVHYDDQDAICRDPECDEDVCIHDEHYYSCAICQAPDPGPAAPARTAP